MSEPTPNPGSHEAIAAGCTCPRVDNRHGKGFAPRSSGEPLFYIKPDCPLHWPDPEAR